MTRGKKADSDSPEKRLEDGIMEERWWFITKKYSQNEHAGEVGGSNC